MAVCAAKRLRMSEEVFDITKQQVTVPARQQLGPMSTTYAHVYDLTGDDDGISQAASRKASIPEVVDLLDIVMTTTQPQPQPPPFPLLNLPQLLMHTPSLRSTSFRFQESEGRIYRVRCLV